MEILCQFLQKFECDVIIFDDHNKFIKIIRDKLHLYRESMILDSILRNMYLYHSQIK